MPRLAILLNAQNKYKKGINNKHLLDFLQFLNSGTALVNSQHSQQNGNLK